MLSRSIAVAKGWEKRRENQARRDREWEDSIAYAVRMDECARIRAELVYWLIGNGDPRDAGIVNGRRIVDEINRICPEKEG